MSKRKKARSGRENEHLASCACPKCAPDVHDESQFESDKVADKRGITDSLKRRVRAEAAALDAMREILKHPRKPSPELAAKHRLAPSERPSPFEWGTLEWYRNELALAHERIRLLESERDRLLDEKRERDPVLLTQINMPGKGGSKSAEVKKDQKEVRKTEAVQRFKKLIATGDRDADDAIKAMVDDGWKRSTLYGYLQDELHRLGRNKKPVKRQAKKK
jgi:hypothetical protein